MTTFETIADVFATRGNGLSTGLPQLDRIAPLGPGHLAVLVGASGVGKSRIARHITHTVDCTHERGTLTVSAPTTIDALDSTLAFRTPATMVIDPLTALVDTDNLLVGPLTAAADPASGLDHGLPGTLGNPARARAATGNASSAGEPHVEQHPVHPAELGRIAEQLRELARRHHLPILVCHRYSPIRDSVTGQIVSTEAANPLLDQADIVAVVRVLADPHQVGLELLRNRLGPTVNLRLPLPLPQDTDDVPDDGGGSADFVPAPRSPHANS